MLSTTSVRTTFVTILVATVMLATMLVAQSPASAVARGDNCMEANRGQVRLCVWLDYGANRVRAYASIGADRPPRPTYIARVILYRNGKSIAARHKNKYLYLGGLVKSRTGAHPIWGTMQAKTLIKVGHACYIVRSDKVKRSGFSVQPARDVWSRVPSYKCR